MVSRGQWRGIPVHLVKPVSFMNVSGPVVAASDYIRALPDMVRAWVPRRYVTLGTDGYGRSDTRAALRRFFEVDRRAIVISALKALADEGSVAASTVEEALARYSIPTENSPPWER